jgi:Short-chain alcohol dehydrogenase of unknown specificity
MKTVLITGCSSGFGLDTARYFLGRDWRVVATMRTPREDLFPASPDLRVLPLDVTDPHSIRAAVAGAGEIDVLVNNAGFGAPAPFELMDMETVRGCSKPTPSAPSPWPRPCSRRCASAGRASSST